MKKVLLVVTAAFSIAAANAVESTAINAAGKTSPVATMTMVYQKNIPDSKFYQGNSCNDAVNRYENDPNAIISWNSSSVVAGIRTKTPCEINFVPQDVYFYGEEYYSICVKKGSTKHFNSPGATFGAVSLQPVDAFIDDINKQNGYSLKPVAFNGSGAVLKQILSGDLDIGLIGTAVAFKQEQTGTIECISSTDPSDPKFIGKQIKLKKGDISIQIAILSKTKDESLKQSIRNSINSPEFKEYVTQGGIKNTSTTATKKHVDGFYNYINGVVQAYINK